MTPLQAEDSTTRLAVMGEGPVGCHLSRAAWGDVSFTYPAVWRGRTHREGCVPGLHSMCCGEGSVPLSHLESEARACVCGRGEREVLCISHPVGVLIVCRSHPLEGKNCVSVSDCLELSGVPISGFGGSDRFCA